MNQIAKEYKKPILLILVISFLLFAAGAIKDSGVGSEKGSFTPIHPPDSIIFQRGGFINSHYAYLVDFGALTMSYYEGTQKSPVSKNKVTLTQSQVDRIRELSRQAIKENKYNERPDADIDYTLTLYDLGIRSETKTYGPIPGPGALDDLQGLLMEIDKKITPVVSDAQKMCAEKGGVWGKIGLSQEAKCNMPTTDSGKACTDSHQCEGICAGQNAKAVSGMCTSWKITSGCYFVINKGKPAGGTLCFD